MQEDHEEADAVGIRLVRYRRSPELEAELAALPEGTGVEFRVAVAGALAPETIVYGIRQLIRAGDEAGAQALTEVLIEKATPILERMATRQFRESADDQQDAVQEAAIQLWREVADTSPKEEFWEVNFVGLLARACSDAAKKIRRQRAQQRPFRRSEDGVWDEELVQPDTAFTGDEQDSFHRDTIIKEAIAVLEGNVQRAAYLRLQGMKVYSKNPNEVTIASVLHVSDSMVRAYIRKAEQVIREWSQQRP